VRLKGRGSGVFVDGMLPHSTGIRWKNGENAFFWCCEDGGNDIVCHGKKLGNIVWFNIHLSQPKSRFIRSNSLRALTKAPVCNSFITQGRIGGDD
jgi:hypothetical protein